MKSKKTAMPYAVRGKDHIYQTQEGGNPECDNIPANLDEFFENFVAKILQKKYNEAVLLQKRRDIYR